MPQHLGNPNVSPANPQRNNDNNQQKNKQCQQGQGFSAYASPPVRVIVDNIQGGQNPAGLLECIGPHFDHWQSHFAASYW
jgi:hypothetical protein